MAPSKLQRLAGLALALLMACSPAVAAKAKTKKQTDLKDWPDGPIRYISKKDEIRTFRSLKNDSDRAMYIERFWARRDPSPDTLVNEYRQLFWERVQQANSNFIGSPKDGWKTDRGKIHILYGPPNEIEEDIHLQTQGLPTGGRGLIRWIYTSRPGQRMDMNNIVVVPFVGDGSGEYRLSHDPTLASVFFDFNAMREKTFAQRMMESIEASRTPQHRSELSVMLDLGKMQEVPPQEQVILERVETLASYRTAPLDVRVLRYHHPEEERTVVSVSVDLTGSPGPGKPAIIARFTPFDATKQPRLLGEDSFLVDTASDGHRLAEGRILLEPGSYTLTVIVADPLRPTTGIHRESVRVGEPARGVRLSDVTWTSRLEPLEFASLISYTEPFIVGPFRVVPKLGSAFRPGEVLRLFYEVYDAELPLHVTYRIEGEDDDGSWIQLGQPQSGEAASGAQGWEFATNERWPVGRYRVRVEVRDAGGNASAVNVPFTLEAPGPS